MFTIALLSLGYGFNVPTEQQLYLVTVLSVAMAPSLSGLLINSKKFSVLLLQLFFFFFFMLYSLFETSRDQTAKFGNNQAPVWTMGLP